MRKLLLLGLAAAGMGLVILAPDTARSAPDRSPGITDTVSPLSALLPRLLDLNVVAIPVEPEPEEQACCESTGIDVGASCCCSKVLLVLQEEKKQDEKKQDKKTRPADKKKPADEKKTADGKSEDDKKEKASQEAIRAGDEARKALVEQRNALMKDGVWNCCIQPGCIFCQMAADGCPCEDNLKKGRAVCPECWGGWQAGQGQVQGVNPAQVPLPSRDTLKKLYSMKAQKLRKGTGEEKKD